jgi:PAS domain S-box-containing protein
VGGSGRPGEHPIEPALARYAPRCEELLKDLRLIGVLLDTRADIVCANEFLFTVAGLPRERVIGRNWIELFIPPERREEVRRVFAEVVASGEPSQYENDILTGSGEARAIRFSNSFLRDRAGNIIGTLSVGEDVTERKRIDEELRLKSLLLDNATDSVFVADLKGKLLFVNQTAYETRGYSREELLSIPLQELDTPESARLIASRFKKMVETREPSVFESAHYLKDGSIMPVEVHARVIDYQGEPAIFGVVRDITKRQEIEAELKLRALLLDSAKDSVFLHDPEGRMIYVNEAAYRDRGYTEEELLAMPLPQLLAPEYAGRVPGRLEHLQRVGSEVFESLHRRKDGSTMPVEVHARVIKIEGRTLILSAIRDVTERKRLEAERAAANELGQALNRINVAITSTLDFEQIMQRVLPESAQALGAETAAITLRDDGYWISRFVYGLPPEQLGTRFANGDLPHIGPVVESKQTLAVNDALNDPQVDRRIMEKYGIRSFLVAPLVVKEEAIGLMFFNHHSAPVTFTDAQIDFAGKLGAAVSLALENARLFSAQRGVADTLQEALLTVPQRLPGLEFGHLYRAATEVTKVGGDFYDLFELEHGRTGIVMGDVSGKGLEAATLTSLVKNTAKAYAYETDSPAEALSKTNDVVVKATGRGVFVTVLLAILEAGTGELVYCNAGHSPAVLRRTTGETSTLPAVSPVIGAFGGFDYRDGRETFGRGDLLVAYTDGLTEARRGGELYGEGRLLQCVQELEHPKPAAVPELMLTDVLKFSGGTLRDDVAILAVART